MRRTILLIAASALLLVGGLVATVAILNSTLYSPAGYVRSYLDALARKDVAGALEFAGVMLQPEASTELLSRDAMPGLSDITLDSDTTNADGTHTVVYSWVSRGESGASSFEVAPAPGVLGIFSGWRLDGTLGWLDLTIEHDDRFTVNDLALQTPAQNAVATYVVFTPGTYAISHDSKYLIADPVTVIADQPVRPDRALTATLDIQPGPAFLAAAQREVDATLDECATQEVLMPTGCPFGQSMANRVASTPAWSITTYPVVAIVPGLQASDWQVPVTGGTAHLLVDVRSLFDGSVTTFDEDVPFRIGYVVSLLPGDRLVLSPQYE